MLLRNIILPLISLGGATNAPTISSNNDENVIAFCFCSLLCFLSVLPVLGGYTHNKSIKIILKYTKKKELVRIVNSCLKNVITINNHKEIRITFNIFV